MSKQRLDYYDRNDHKFKGVYAEGVFSDTGESWSAAELSKRFSNLDDSLSNEIKKTNKTLTEVENSRTGEDGTVYAALKDRLNSEYRSLRHRLDRIVNITDFGAVGDGKADCTKAFVDAMGKGNVIVLIPKGTYKVSELKVPSYTKLVGDGYNTIIKLLDSAPVETNLITNSDWIYGNTHIVIEDLLLDWNINRAKASDTLKVGTNGCGIIFVNSQFIWMTRVKSINARRHCFDISSSNYHVSGNSPERYETDGCRFVWFDSCQAEGAGDDNFTTHFSEHIWFDKCISRNPSGLHFTEEVNNSNCFEIDDGSRYVTLDSCYAYGGARGFEAKAHDHSPAPFGIKFINCTAEKCVRSFDLRHNGFGLATEPESKSAYDVDIIGCTSINPVTFSSYATLSARALAVAAYRNVNIDNFTAIGGSDGVTEEVIAFYQKSYNINANNIKIRGFKNANTDIRLVGGDNKTNRVNLSNISIMNSALRGIAVGDGITEWSLVGLTALNNGRKDSIGITTTSDTGKGVMAVTIEGYQTSSSIGNTIFRNTMPTLIPGGAMMAVSSGIIGHERAAIISSTDYCEATGFKSTVISSSSSKASGERSTVISSGSSSEAKDEYTSVISSRDSIADSVRAVVMSSYNVINPQGNSVVGGWNDKGNPSSQNRKWQLNSENGNITATGTVTGGGSFSDYAEYFESASGKSLPSGSLVTLDGDKIKLADEGDDILGVISETAGIVLGEMSFHWQERYLRNEFGGLIYEEREVEFKDESGEIKRELMTLPVENPEYNEDKQYISRADRPEWNVVGLLGQVYIRIDNTIKTGDYFTAINGVATKSSGRGQGWRVMKITSPYDNERGYGVALCLIR